MAAASIPYYCFTHSLSRTHVTLIMNVKLQDNLKESLKTFELEKTNRIIVIGSPGSGKTSLAKFLAQKHQLPNHSIDDFYWQPGWQRPRNNDWLQILENYMSSNRRWIIDGNYVDYLPMRLQYADIVIYLDVPPLLCLYRFIKRAVLRYCDNNHNMPRQSFNKKITKRKLSFQPRLLYKILFFRKTTKPKIFDMINLYNATSVVLGKNYNGI